ncbi:MAG: hypothetical protein NUV80_01750 [Candidatus Berkelbacteria bacterium]|nr:hypothetical protein [Candidatus Berkelbacteria bacterium]MCR4307262.1 hypothetical protein [Candidatus Berkelbacteria bacterium]
MTTLDPFEPIKRPITEEEIAKIRQIFKENGNEIDEYQAEQELFKLYKLFDLFADEYFENIKNDAAQSSKELDGTSES